MTETDYVRIMELLASKICHDLISPVGAISNGVEILEELGPDAGEDVTGLISFSATQASSKLKVMRMAYGLGGAETSIRTEDVHKNFADFLEGESRLNLDWDPHAPLSIPSKTGLPKMILCCLLLAIEGLPRGGKISVENGGDDSLVIRAEGDNAHFRENFKKALEHSISTDDLDPKLVHPYVTGLLAERYGFTIVTEEASENIIFLRLKSSVVS